MPCTRGTRTRVVVLTSSTVSPAAMRACWRTRPTEGRSSSGELPGELPMDTGAPFERVATCWRFSLGVGRKGRASGRTEFVRHQDCRMTTIVGHPFATSLNLTYRQGKRLPADSLWVSLPADHREHSIQFIRFDQYIARLGALARADDPPRLHEVHQPSRLGETDPQLALQ